MKNTEKEKIQEGVLEISNRVKKFGRKNEAVKVNIDLVLTGQNAINYKVMKIFCPQLTSQELVELTFHLGIKNGAELVTLLAIKHGIRV